MQKRHVLRTFKSIFITTLVTLFYVHQQVEIVKAGYEIDKNRKALSYLLDQHQSLVYNLNKLEKPSALEQKLASGRITLARPEKNDVFRLSNSRHYSPGAGNLKSNNIYIRFLDLFSDKAEAQAR